MQMPPELCDQLDKWAVDHRAGPGWRAAGRANGRQWRPPGMMGGPDERTADGRPQMGGPQMGGPQMGGGPMGGRPPMQQGGPPMQQGEPPMGGGMPDRCSGRQDDGGPGGPGGRVARCKAVGCRDK